MNCTHQVHADDAALTARFLSDGVSWAGAGKDSTWYTDACRHVIRTCLQCIKPCQRDRNPTHARRSTQSQKS